MDPIAYWLAQSSRFPTLSRFAIDIFSIPAASADCERNFSEAGDLLSVRRLRMKVDLLSALQSLRSFKRIGLQRSPENLTPRQELTIDVLDELIEDLSDLE
jgi:hypothetical protein